MSEKFLKIEE